MGTEVVLDTLSHRTRLDVRHDVGLELPVTTSADALTEIPPLKPRVNMRLQARRPTHRLGVLVKDEHVSVGHVGNLG